MILEVALLDVRAGQESAFEAAFAQAQTIIASTRGYIAHELQRCIETPNRYLLLVEWRTLEEHTVGFRGSPQYQQWKELLHHFLRSIPNGGTLCPMPPPIPSSASGGGLGWGITASFVDRNVYEGTDTCQLSQKSTHARYSTRAAIPRLKPMSF